MLTHAFTGPGQARLTVENDRIVGIQEVRKADTGAEDGRGGGQAAAAGAEEAEDDRVRRVGRGGCVTRFPFSFPHTKLMSPRGAGSFVVVETVTVDGDESWSTTLPADCPFPSSTAKAAQSQQARAGQ